MAQVTKNPDGTFNVMLSAKELQALARLGTEQSVTSAKCLETHITDWLAVAQTDFLNADWPSKQPKYAALTVVQQAKVDTILNGG